MSTTILRSLQTTASSDIERTHTFSTVERYKQILPEVFMSYEPYSRIYREMPPPTVIGSIRHIGLDTSIERLVKSLVSSLDPMELLEVLLSPLTGQGTSLEAPPNVRCTDPLVLVGITVARTKTDPAKSKKPIPNS